MRIGLFESSATTGGTIDDHIAAAATAHEQGFASWWMPQIFGFESLSVLAIVGREVPGIELGTAVVPTYPRHPVTMAHRVPRARKIRSSRVATTNHVSRAGVNARPPSRAVRAVTASTAS